MDQPAGEAGALPQDLKPSASSPKTPPVPLTTSTTWRLVRTPYEGDKRVSPNEPAGAQALIRDGVAAAELGPGFKRYTHVISSDARDTRDVAPTSEAGTRLARFVHLADYQLADDESVVRVPTLDDTGKTSGAYRPQEGFGCQIIDATHRTINRLHAEQPIDFALMGGDNIDNAQANELDWFLTLVRGGPIECDSGEDNNLDPSLPDEKDPFIAAGLIPPMYWVMGNHDVNVQGESPVFSALRERSQGSQSGFGVRDYRQPLGPLTDAEVPADLRRKLLYTSEILSVVTQDGSGHGLRGAELATEKAFYTFDHGPLRFVVLDTTAEIGGHAGLLRRSQIDQWIRPTLDRAEQDRKHVVLVSHHSSGSLTDDGGLGLFPQADAVTTQEWLDFLGGYRHIVLSLVAHSHRHTLKRLQTGDHEVFEVMTSSLIDYPGQFRLAELFQVGNDWLRMELTAVDYLDFDSDIVKSGRELMFLDYVSGWGSGGYPDESQINLDLWVRIR